MSLIFACVSEAELGHVFHVARASCIGTPSTLTSSSVAGTFRGLWHYVPGASAPAALSPVSSAEGALDAAAAVHAAVRIHGLAVAWTHDAVFYVRAAPEHWEAVAAVLERGEHLRACGGAAGGPSGRGDPERGPPGQEGGAWQGARRAAEKATHGAKDQLKALAGVCSCEGGRCGSCLMRLSPLPALLCCNGFLTTSVEAGSRMSSYSGYSGLQYAGCMMEGLLQHALAMRVIAACAMQ